MDVHTRILRIKIEIEDFSEEDVNQLDSESFNDSFDAGVIAHYVGPTID